jgi:dipeptidase E
MKRLWFSLVFLTGSILLAATPEFRTSPRVSVLVSGGSMMNGDRFADSTLATMREHFAGCQRVALVLHATFPAERDAMEGRLTRALAHIGVPAAESLHRRDAAGALELLRAADGILVGGGETFVLLGELHRTGQLAVIRERVLAGVPYAGVSAGANVAGPVVGTTNDFPVAEIPTREALGLFPASINPHHPVPETKGEFDGRIGKIKTYLKFNPDQAVLGLANVSLARLRDGRITLLTGRGWLYRGTEVRELKLGEPASDLIQPAPKR